MFLFLKRGNTIAGYTNLAKNREKYLMYIYSKIQKNDL